MKLRIDRRIALLAALLLLTLSLTALAPPAADALPACGTHYKYYTCGTSTQVGYRYYNCSGVLVTSSGYTTSCFTRNTYCCLN
ncbi:MAG TPA: hypothetical protein VGX68_05575 [Thermoanaerobaculia bacterium]|jgi:hypothetical protein|nr:hypothetical protein [Thermoanaerobaculia bacterium]